MLYVIESIGGKEGIREIGDTHVVPGVAEPKSLLNRMKEKQEAPRKSHVEFVRSRGGQPVHGVRFRNISAWEKRRVSAPKRSGRMVRAGLSMRKNRTPAEPAEKELLGKLSSARRLWFWWSMKMDRMYSFPHMT